MAKGKSLNPADAYRKSQRKKELKKNKAERSKARDFAFVKKDTREIEDEIEKLEALPTPSPLKSELQKINEKKEEYVKEHPEQRRLVYKARPRDGEKDDENRPLKKDRRNIYYDPVMNPYGVPPPGLPYMERPLLPGEVDSDEEMEGMFIIKNQCRHVLVYALDSDEDIPLPPGLPPGSELVGNDDDIAMPDGPPPDDDDDEGPPPFLRIFTPSRDRLVPLPPPPGLMVPLSSVPHQTYQAHRADKIRSTLPHNSSLPPKPVAAAQLANATVSAAPELRDFKKEATAFVPTAIKRKKAPGAGSSRVDAAPSVGPVDGEEEPHVATARPDLVGLLKQQFGSAPLPQALNNAPTSAKSAKDTKKDDYAKFMEEMSDIL
ncbi:WW domain binding protein 11-domain-containing protein [Cyathus striatus]|nr:WW domain binding protein 11-domain-containing protein [Cyathus striatus]